MLSLRSEMHVFKWQEENISDIVHYFFFILFQDALQLNRILDLHNMQTYNTSFSEQ